MGVTFMRQTVGLEGSCLQSRREVHSSPTSQKVLLLSNLCLSPCSFDYFLSCPSAMETGITPFSPAGTQRAFQNLLNVSASLPLNRPKCSSRDLIHAEPCSARKPQGPCRLIAKVTLIISLVCPAKLYCLGKGGGVRQVQSLTLLSVFHRSVLQTAQEEEENGRRKPFIFPIINLSGAIKLLLKLFSWKALGETWEHKDRCAPHAELWKMPYCMRPPLNHL